MTHVKLILGDAYKEIHNLVKNNIKVDHIITDPPYNISKKNNFSTMKSAHRKGVYFGDWDRHFNLYKWIPEYIKLLKPGGTFIIFSSWRNVSYIADCLEKHGMLIKDLIKWIKTNPMPRNVNRRYVQDTEFAVWSVKKGKKWVFNKPSNVGYLRAEFHTPVVSGHEKTGHPTQKSLLLMEKIIQIHTNKGQLILDPFMGSGTTGVAAINFHRQFIGIEINKKYFNMARTRIKNDENNISLF